MANNIKGITVEIGGDTGPLDKALKGVNKTSRDLQSELREVNKQLKLDPTNTTLLTQKQKLLAESITNTKGKLETLKQAEQQAQEQFKQGKISEEQYRALQREVIKTEQNLKGLEKESKDVGKAFDEANKKSSFFETLKNKVKDSAEQIKTAFGAVGIAVAGYLKGAVDKATGAEQSTKRLSNLLQNQGMTAIEAKKNIDTFTKSITDMSSFSGGEAKEALQILTEKGIDFSDALKESTTLANVAAGTGETLADSANLVADAYNGKAKALVSLGILSKDEVKQLGDSEKATISMADVQDRLNKRFGGAAQTDLQSYSGKLKENQNTINAAKSQIGQALLPVLAQVAELIAKIIAPIAQFIKENPKFTAALLSITAILGTLIGGLSVFNTVTTAMGTMGIAFKGVGAAAGGSILPMLGVIAVIALVAFAVYEIIKHWSQISDFFKKLWTDIKIETEKIWNGLKSFFSNTWNSITDTCSNIWNGIGNFFKNLWTSIKNTTENIWNGIKDYFVNVWTNIKEFFINTFTNMKTGIENTLNNIKNAFVNTWTNIKATITSIVLQFVYGINEKFQDQIELIKDVFIRLKEIFVSIWTAIKTVVLGVVLLLCDLVTGNFSKLKEDLINIILKLRGLFSTIWDDIKAIFVNTIMAIAQISKKLFDDFIARLQAIWETFKTFMSTLWEGIKNNAINTWNNLKNGVHTTIINMANGIQNTWNEFKNFMSNLWEGIKTTAINSWNALANGVVNLCHNIKQGVIDIWNGLINWFTELPGRLYSIGVNMFTSMKSGVTNTVYGVKDAIVSGINSAIDFITSLPSKAYTWGVDFIDGLVNGIKSCIHKVQDAVSGVADKIRSFLHFSVPDEGPLVDYESWMPDFMQGLSKGIENSKSIVTSAIKGLSTDMSIGVKTQMTPALSASEGGQGITNINFNGTYSFTDKKDIDYFMNQAALLVKRKK